MKSDTSTVQQQFQDRRQYRIPFYQRSYVWTKDTQWQPLWMDIVEKAEARILGQDSSPHFLGAIVLEPQKRDGLRGVEAFHVIDGQQRLSTLQYLLAALVMVFREEQHEDLVPLLRNCIWNPNPDTMEEPSVEIFKVWPTFRDRDHYRAALNAISREELKTSFPDSFTQAGKLRQIGIRHPPSLEAIWFFQDQIRSWVGDADNERLSRLETLAEAILRDLKLVWIMLDENDDAQVIFETLNGRGAELHATDLIRNFIFLRADRENANSAALYESYWKPFEDEFWSANQRRGRLNKPRLEWFVQTALQAEMGEEVEIGTLYAGYKKYALGGNSLVGAETQLRVLSRYSEEYKKLISGNGTDAISAFGRRISVWDASAAQSLALKIAFTELPQPEQVAMFDHLISYIVRRAVCGLTSKNYNHVFLQILRRLNEQPGLSSDGLKQVMASLQGAASRWPDDKEFGHAWLTSDALTNVGGSSRVKAILIELENRMRSPRSEEAFSGNVANLDVDHILPRHWYDHWPIDGELVSSTEAFEAAYQTTAPEISSPRRDNILRRESLCNVIGNLTLVHYGVNRSVKNYEFERKREAFFTDSNLHLNRSLMQASDWDESAIEERGRDMLELAKQIWRGPGNQQ